MHRDVKLFFILSLTKQVATILRSRGAVWHFDHHPICQQGGPLPLCAPLHSEARLRVEQGWKFMSYSQCQELCQQASCLLIGCTRVNNQSEARSATFDNESNSRSFRFSPVLHQPSPLLTYQPFPLLNNGQEPIILSPPGAPGFSSSANDQVYIRGILLIGTSMRPEMQGWIILLTLFWGRFFLSKFLSNTCLC